MATTSSISLTTRNSLLRPIALGGMIIGIVQLIIQEWLVYSLLEKNPFISNTNNSSLILRTVSLAYLMPISSR
jgi:hypothetical protein